MSLPQDLRKACSVLEQDDGVKVVAVKEGRVLSHARGRGIRPVLELVDRLGEELQGASVADRVIGRAAGFILIEAKVKAVYGQVLSLEAEELLQKHEIAVYGEQKPPYICKPDRVERCLMEQQVLGEDDPGKAVFKLRNFLGL